MLFLFNEMQISGGVFCYLAEKGILIDSLTLKTNDKDFNSKSHAGRHHSATGSPHIRLEYAHFVFCGRHFQVLICARSASARSKRSKHFNSELREVIVGTHLRKHLRLLVGYCETSVTGSHAWVSKLRKIIT